MAGESYSRAYKVYQWIVEDWQRTLMVCSLVINLHDDMRTWLKYASLCGKSGRLIEAFQHTQHFVQGMQQQAQHAAEDKQHQQELHKLMARTPTCFLELGEWQLSLQGFNDSTIPKELQYYSHSTKHDRN
ncbi:serine/threonine-protein kinase mTOR-like [Oncorhynchus kisutch]|uniref:serine/threonine-protein kinase mTOR-like n=1 Tax=Oncorhynchus kisutch TaxID=8019 RepID=UPI0012DDA41F|nr:serine/threonine-protein kinase mTOR-like [Oncorhynchus kisutch]